MLDTFYIRMYIDLFTDNVQAYKYSEDLQLNVGGFIILGITF